MSLTDSSCAPCRDQPPQTDEHFCSRNLHRLGWSCHHRVLWGQRFFVWVCLSESACITYCVWGGKERQKWPAKVLRNADWQRKNYVPVGKFFSLCHNLDVCYWVKSWPQEMPGCSDPRMPSFLAQLSRRRRKQRRK